jgi:uncharacterized protein YfdQ (DUF2303 family)
MNSSFYEFVKYHKEKEKYKIFVNLHVLRDEIIHNLNLNTKNPKL